MRWIFGIATCICLLAPPPAGGASLDDIAITVPSATILVVGNCDLTSAQTTGALPLVLPYNLTDGGSCTVSGTVSLSNTGGRLRIEVDGTPTLGAALQIAVNAPSVEFTVPGVGDALTPAIRSVQQVSSSLLDVSFFIGSGPTLGIGQYTSAVTGGEFTLAGSVGGVPPATALSHVVHMIPGDAIVWSDVVFDANYMGDSGSASFDEVYEMAFTVPSQPAMASISPSVAWLLAGALLGLGVKLARRAR